jgi:electron transport complex protein RnfD
MTVLAFKLGMPVADGITAATPLDAFKFRGSLTVDEFMTVSSNIATLGGMHVGIGWQWINAAFLAGGIYLVYRGICGWLMPATMLLTLAVLALVFYDSGSSQSLGSPMFHLFSGATMLGAFFILTDPVTSPDSTEGKVIFAVGVGSLTFLIRNIGAYPDGLAFAVLLMNTATPFIDQVRWRYA